MLLDQLVQISGVADKTRQLTALAKQQNHKAGAIIWAIVHFCVVELASLVVEVNSRLLLTFILKIYLVYICCIPC